MRNLDLAKRIIIKVGTSSITHKNGNLNFKQIDGLARIISDLTNSGKQVALVSSGAITAGVSRLNLAERPKDVALKQAVACVGQNALMEIYNKFFATYGYTVGQLLLSKYIFDHSVFSENARESLFKLWGMGVIPIINENDSISADEIKLGDNDNLSGYVARLIDADLLIMLSDIDGVYDKNPKQFNDAKIIPQLRKDDEILSQILSNQEAGAFGTGGIGTKINAGLLCAESGVNAVIANSADLKVIYDILDNKIVGTFFPHKK